MTEITDEMVEAVARRMCEAMGVHPDARPDYGGHNHPMPNWFGLRDTARVAIAAHIAITDLLDLKPATTRP